MSRGLRRASWIGALALLVGAGVVWWPATRRGSLRPDAEPRRTTAAAPLAPSEADPLESDTDVAAPQRRSVALTEPTSPAEFALPAPGTSGVRGRVVDEEGRAIPGAGVSLSVQGTWNHETKSMEDGAFRIGGAPANARSQSLTVRSVGRAPLRLELERLPSAQIVDCGDVVLRSGEWIRGIVLDELGRPVPDADVFWVAAKPFQPLYSTEGELGARSDVEGRFRIEHVALGAVRLAAAKRGFVPIWNPPVAVARGRGTDGVVVRTESGVELHGRIYDRDTGTGLRARLRIGREGERRCSVESGADGHYAIDELRRDCRYTFGVERPGFSYSHLASDTFGGGNVLVTDAATIEQGFDFTMRANGTPPSEEFVVRVSDALDGTPLDGALVGVAMWPDSPGPRTMSLHRMLGRTGRDGIARIAVRPADGEFLAASAPHHRPARISGGPSKAGEYSVALERAAVIRVRVLADGQPAASVSVELSEFLRQRAVMGGAAGGADDPQFSVVDRATTDELGSVEFDVPASVTYRVRARSRDGRGAQALMQMRDGFQLAETELPLAPLAALVGRLDCGGARPLVQTVIALARDGSSQGATTDTEGCFVIESLEPGDYFVSAVRSLEGRLPRDAGIRDERRSRPGGIAVTVAAGERRELVVPVPCGAGALEGSVRVNGRPLVGRFVRLEWVDSAPGPSPQFQVAGELSTLTDERGEFRFDGLLSGRWELEVARHGTGVRSWPLARAECSISDGATTSWQADVEAGGVVLRLVDAETNAPAYWPPALQLVPDAKDKDPKSIARARRDRRSIEGFMQDVLDLPEVEPGRYQLMSAGGDLVGRPFDVAAGLRQEITLELSPKR